MDGNLYTYKHEGACPCALRIERKAAVRNATAYTSWLWTVVCRILHWHVTCWTRLPFSDEVRNFMFSHEGDFTPLVHESIPSVY